MDGDFEVIPPHGTSAIPMVHTDAAALLQALVRSVSEKPDSAIELYHGIAGNPAEGRPWVATVIAEHGGQRWIMRVPTARQFGFRLFAERTLAWALGDLVTLARLFFDTADQAEALAEAPNPFSLVEKQS